MSGRRTLPEPVAGERYGHWTIVGEAPPRARNRQVYPECDCGTRTVVLWSNVVRGKSTQCGRTDCDPQSIVGYNAAHERVEKERGPAWHYICEEGCGRQADHWSWMLYSFWLMETEGPRAFMPYSLDPWDYRPLCAPCHKRFDTELMPEWRASIWGVAV